MILITVYTDFFTTLFHIYNPHPTPSGKAVTEMQADVRVSDCNQLAESKKQSQEKPAWNLHKHPPTHHKKSLNICPSAACIHLEK